MARCKKLFVLVSTVVALSALVTTSSGQWLPSKTLQAGRSRMVAVAANGKVYFAGGYDGSGATNKIDIYDNSTGEITISNKPLTVGRADLAGVYNENRNKIYYGGGQLTNSSKSAVIEVFDIATNSYDAQLALPQATAYLCAASWGDKVMFAGGGNGTAYYDKLYLYNTLTPGAAPQTFVLSEARDQIAVAVIGSKVIMAGGHRGSGVYSDNIDIFDMATETFVTHSYQLSEARAFLAAAVVGSKAFFGGGQKGGGSNLGSTVVDVVDLTAAPGTIGPLQLSQPRYYLTAIAVDTKVFFAGGGQGPTSYNDVDIWDVSGVITTLPTKEDQLSAPRGALVAATLGTKALFASGINGGILTPVVDIYDIETDAPLATLAPTDGAINVAYTTDPVLTFNEKVKKGTGNILIMDGGVIIATVPVSSGTVTVSNNTVTIDLGGFKSKGMISIEMAAGVIEDLVGNDFAGFAPANPWNFTIETLVTTAQPSTLDVFEKGGTDKEVTLTVNDFTKINTVKFISRGISDDPAILQSTTLNVTGNIIKHTLTNSNFTDPIGLYHYFEYTDLTGLVEKTTGSRTYIDFPTKESSAKIPSLRHGNTMDKYQIISIPLELESKTVTTVFSQLGSYNKDVWRLYDYANNDNREYPGFTEIKTGWGYWLITLDEATINPGAGTTARFTNESTNTPFTITLKKDWNLIGNPYNFVISWTDILAANPDVSSNLQSDVGIYKSGEGLTLGVKINPYRGAFVKNNSGGDLTIQIPVRDHKLTADRAGSEDVDLESYNWHLPIAISDGTLTNSTGGIGMNKQATLTGEDRFDRLPIPIPSGMGMSEIAFPHPEIDKHFVREIVPPADSYVWNFEVHKSGDQPLTLTWDPTLFVESDNQLVLADSEFGSIKDMKTESEYTVPPSTSSLKVIFGNREFIQNTLDEFLPLAGYPYPNPAIDEVRIPFHIPSKAGKMNVDIEVVSSHGAKVATLANGNYESGSHEVVWTTQGKSGLYIVQIKVGTEKPKRAKIVVN